MSGCGCKCGPQQAAQQQFGSDAAGDAFEPDFGLPEAGGQSAVELFEALTDAGAAASAVTDEADQELAEVALEDDLAAQQELPLPRHVVADAEPLGLHRRRPGQRRTHRPPQRRRHIETDRVMQQDLIAGDTLNFLVTLADYPASIWTLYYRGINATAKLDITATADGDTHLVSVPPATTTSRCSPTTSSG